MLIGVVIVIIVMIVLFTSFNRPKSDSSNTTRVEPTTLVSYANTDATVTYAVDGVIKGNEQYNSIVITVSQTGRTIQVINGYQGQILKSQTTVNNQEAYTQFLAAIQNAGFLKREDKASGYKHRRSVSTG